MDGQRSTKFTESIPQDTEGHPLISEEHSLKIGVSPSYVTSCTRHGKSISRQLHFSFLFFCCHIFHIN